MTLTRDQIDKIKDGLILRRVTLNEGATRSSIKELERVAGLSLHASIIDIFLAFDGFALGDFDANSELSVWSVLRIISSLEHSANDGRVPFSDFGMGIDVYSFSADDPSQPITSVFSGRVISESWDRFWQDLIDGRLDVPR